MFSLIITIVSIALVVALVAATMYSGGDTLNQGRARAEAAAFVNGGQQVGGAAAMHVAMESVQPADVAALVSKKYLATVPVVKGSGLTLDPAAKQVTSSVASREVCLQINKAAGVTDTFDPATGTAVAVDAAALNGFIYGCTASGADNNTNNFVLKY